MLPVSNLNDFATGGGRLNPLTGEFNAAGLGNPVGYDKFGQSLGYNPPSSTNIENLVKPIPGSAPGMGPAQNSNPFGFTAPTGPSTQALVPYYNKATGETWNAPSGGYTPPSADWLQGSPGNSTVAPLPGFAPGLDPVKQAANAGMAPSFLPQAEQDRLNALNLQNMNREFKSPEASQQPFVAPRAPTDGIAYEDPEFFRRSMERMNQANTVQQPYMPIMGGNPNVGILSPAIGQQPRPMPQQPAPTPNTGGLSALVPQQPMVNRPASGLNSLVRPQPFMRNQIAPRAGSLPSLRFNPRLNQSLPIPFTRPTFRR